MDARELSRKIRDVTPFINHLDVEITRGAGKEYAEIIMPMKPEFTQHLGHAHGGVVGSLADIAANLACKYPTVTLDYKINFLKAAKGQHLIARSWPVREDSGFIVVQSEVFASDNGRESLVATCLATLVPSSKPGNTS
ncbi:MAG: PaaI family thioesterase [Ketobacteraceae bacterium]|nr:PaaI family thioesterase [Ketobacteraceae bacterium]